MPDETAASRTYRAEEVVLRKGITLTLKEGEQVFFAGTKYDGQYRPRHSFIVLREVNNAD